jgi:hypothetical protein
MEKEIKNINIPNTSVQKEKRETKREMLYEKIDKKVDIIENTRNFVKNISSLEPTDFEKECQNEMGSIKEFFDPDIQNKYLEVNELDGKCENLHKQLQLREREIEEEIEKLSEEKYRELYGEEKGLWDWKIIEELLEKDEKYQNIDILLRETQSEINSLIKNDDVKFLRQMGRFFGSVAKKRKQVFATKEQYKVDPEKFWEALYEEIEELKDIEKDKIEISFSGLNINLIFPKNEFAKIRTDKRISGFHRSFTVFNFIKDGPDKNDTINHEENHNLSESFTDPFGSLGDFSKDVESLNRLKELRAPAFMINNGKKAIERKIKNYIYNFSHEIIADIDSIPKGDIHTFLFTFLRAYDKTVSSLRKIEDADVKNKIKNVLSQTEERFIEYIDRLSMAFFIANKLGGEKDQEKLKYAIILFGPDKLRKAEKYIRNRVGEKNYDMLINLRSFLGKGSYFNHFLQFVERYGKDEKLKKSELLHAILGERSSTMLRRAMAEKSISASFFHLHNIKRLFKLVVEIDSDNVKKISSLIEKEKIGQLEYIDFYEAVDDDPSLLKMDNILELDKNLKYIAEKLSVPEFGSLVEERLAYYFFDRNYEKAMRMDNFSELESIYQNWPLSKEVFKRQILNTIEFLLSDYEDYQNKDYTEKTIKTSNYWIFLTKIGMDKEAEEALNKIEEK